MKNTAKVGIGIAIIAVLGIVISVFTNIDELTYSQVEDTVSEIEINTNLESLDNPLRSYLVDTKCELYEAFVFYPNEKILRKIAGQDMSDWLKIPADEIQEAREKEEQRLELIAQKYNDRLYDYHKQHGIKWWDEPGRDYLTDEDWKFLRENQLLEMLEILEADPKLIDDLDLIYGAETIVGPYVLTQKDVKKDPECAKRIKNSPHSSKFIFQ